MIKPEYRIVLGYLFDKVLQKTRNYLKQLENAKLIKALENTKIEQTRADKYIAQLFEVDTEEIAIVRILEEVTIYFRK